MENKVCKLEMGLPRGCMECKLSRIEKINPYDDTCEEIWCVPEDRLIPEDDWGGRAGFCPLIVMDDGEITNNMNQSQLDLLEKIINGCRLELCFLEDVIKECGALEPYLDAGARIRKFSLLVNNLEEIYDMSNGKGNGS